MLWKTVVVNIIYEYNKHVLYVHNIYIRRYLFSKLAVQLSRKSGQRYSEVMTFIKENKTNS